VIEEKKEPTGDPDPRLKKDLPGDLKIQDSNSAFTRMWFQGLLLVSYTVGFGVLFPVFIGIPMVLGYFRLAKVLRYFIWLLAFSLCFAQLKEFDVSWMGIWFGFVLVPAMVIPALLSRALSFGAILGRSLTVTVVFLGLIICGLSMRQGQDPVHFVLTVWPKLRVSLQTALMGNKVFSTIVAADDQSEVIQGFVNSLVGFVAQLMVFYHSFMIWVGLRGMSADQKQEVKMAQPFFSSWTVPAFLVWPSIVMFALLMFGTGIWSLIGANGFQMLMVLYFLQGISIVQFFFEVFKIDTIYRVLGFIACFTFFFQHVIALGFFDLWFDFRSKVKQT
jgi:hypothetical protein